MQSVLASVHATCRVRKNLRERQLSPLPSNEISPSPCDMRRNSGRVNTASNCPSVTACSPRSPPRSDAARTPLLRWIALVVRHGNTMARPREHSRLGFNLIDKCADRVELRCRGRAARGLGKRRGPAAILHPRYCSRSRYETRSSSRSPTRAAQWEGRLGGAK